MELNDQENVLEEPKDQDSLFIGELLKIRNFYEVVFEAISDEIEDMIEEKTRQKADLQLSLNDLEDRELKNSTQIEITQLDEDVALLKLKELIKRFFEGYVDADDSELLHEIKKGFDQALIDLRKAQFLRLELYAEKMELILSLNKKNNQVGGQLKNLVADLADLENFEQIVNLEEINEIIENGEGFTPQLQLLLDILFDKQESLKDPKLMAGVLGVFENFVQNIQNLTSEQEVEIDAEDQYGQSSDNLEQQELAAEPEIEPSFQKGPLKPEQLKPENSQIIAENDHEKVLMALEKNQQAAQGLEEKTQVFLQDAQLKKDLLQEKLKLSKKLQQESEARLLQQQQLQQELQGQLEISVPDKKEVLQKQIQDYDAKLLLDQKELERVNQQLKSQALDLQELDKIIIKAQSIQQQNKLILERNEVQFAARKEQLKASSNSKYSSRQSVSLSDELGFIDLSPSEISGERPLPVPIARDKKPKNIAENNEREVGSELSKSANLSKKLSLHLDLKNNQLGQSDSAQKIRAEQHADFTDYTKELATEDSTQKETAGQTETVKELNNQLDIQTDSEPEVLVVNSESPGVWQKMSRWFQKKN